MPVLYPGELGTTSKPFGSIGEMWLAFGALSTNKTSAINGDKYFTLPPRVGLSLHSHAGGPTQGRPAAPQPSKGSSGSSRTPFEMNIATSSSPDPFLSSAAEWPANSTVWDEVFQVAEFFATPDIPLWTPLTNPEERGQVFRDNKGRCLNCHGTDHSFRNCAEPFINASGCMNPQLANLASTMKPTTVGSVACGRIVDPTVLAAKTHARRLYCTTTNPPRAATTTAATVGTPTLTSPSMMPHNINTAMQAALRTLAKQRTR